VWDFVSTHLDVTFDTAYTIGDGFNFASTLFGDGENQFLTFDSALDEFTIRFTNENSIDDPEYWFANFIAGLTWADGKTLALLAHWPVTT
jgi:hypothetical protein